MTNSQQKDNKDDNVEDKSKKSILLILTPFVLLILLKILFELGLIKR
jgi:hypothetical protein